MMKTYTINKVRYFFLCLCCIMGTTYVHAQFVDMSTHQEGWNFKQQDRTVLQGEVTEDVTGQLIREEVGTTDDIKISGTFFNEADNEINIDIDFQFSGFGGAMVPNITITEINIDDIDRYSTIYIPPAVTDGIDEVENLNFEQAIDLSINVGEGEPTEEEEDTSSPITDTDTEDQAQTESESDVYAVSTQGEINDAAEEHVEQVSLFEDIKGGLSLNNYPNPFVLDTEINFNVTESGPIYVTVFNAAGQRIHILANGQHYDEGNYAIRIPTYDWLPGVYYCQFATTTEQVVQPMLKID